MTTTDTGPAGAPRWLWLVVLLGAAGLVAVGLIGVLFAMAGAYRTWVVLPTAVVVTAAAWPTLERLSDDRPTSAEARRWAVAAVVTIVLLGGWSATRPGHHVVTTHDPGVYAGTAVLLSDGGALRVSTWAEDELITAVLDEFDDAQIVGPGTYPEGDDEIEFQFSHAPSAVMAVAFDLGGRRALFATPALVGMLALGATYLLATRFVRSHALALAVTAALGSSIPWLYVTRSTYSEPFTLAVTATALALVTTRQPIGPERAAAAGVFIGATMLMRIDGQLSVVALLAVGVVLALAGTSGAALLAGAAGALVPTVVGIVDLVAYSGGYWDDHQESAGLLRLAAVVGAGAVWAAHRFRASPAVAELRTRRLPAAATGAAVTVAVLLASGWLVRPRVQTARTDWNEAYSDRVAGLQVAAGLDPDPSRSYAELTIASIGWYLGPATVALGIVGIALLVRRAVRDPIGPAAVLTVFFVVGGAIYLVDWRITPYQPWASRRFVPIVFPVFVVAAAVGAEALARRSARWREVRGWRMVPSATAVTVVAAAAIVAPTVLATWPVRDLAEQRGFAEGLDEVCGEVDDATVFVIGTPTLHVPLRIWCGTAAAASGRGGAQVYERYAELAQAACTPAILAFTDRALLPSPDSAWGPYEAPVIVEMSNDVFPEESILDAPDAYAPQTLTVAMLRVALPSGCGA